MNYSVSLSDITAALKLSGEPVDSDALEKEEDLKGLLFCMGLDIQKRFLTRYCKHRNMQDKIVSCLRYEGFERRDKEWLASGYATRTNSDFANEAQEYVMPNTSSTTSQYHLDR